MWKGVPRPSSEVEHTFCFLFFSLMAPALSPRQPDSLISSPHSSVPIPHQRHKGVLIVSGLVPGGPLVTAREYGVVKQLMAGQTTKQIAQTLGVKPSTIRSYLRSLFGKTHTSTRAALVWWWVQHSGGTANKRSGRNGKDRIL